MYVPGQENNHNGEQRVNILPALVIITVAGISGIVLVDSLKISILIGFLTLVINQLFQIAHQKKLPNAVRETMKAENAGQRQEIRHDLRNELITVKGPLNEIKRQTNGDLERRFAKLEERFDRLERLILKTNGQ